MRVQLDASVAAGESTGIAQARALRDALADSRLVEVVGADDASASTRVYLINPRPAAAPTDPVPQLGPVPDPVWAVVNAEGQLVMPPKALDQYRDVSANLDTLARYRQALELENPNPNSALRGKFELNLLRRGVDGKWIVAEPEVAGGLPVYHDGDDIAFEIKSHHDAKAFVNLLDFSPTGAISLVFPAPNATDQITPTVRFQIGTRPDDEFAVSYPTEFPYAGNAAGAPTDAIETVKLFVTTSDAGFSFLEQQGVRSAGRTGALQVLWETAVGGSPVRAITRKAMPVETDDWTTIVRPLIVRRKGQAAVTPISVAAVPASA
jgi:hypothetical protein